jgi:hypothetical protein
MARSFTPPQPFEEGLAPFIAMTPIDSSQIHSRGYDAATSTLALRFLAPGERDLPVAQRVGGDAVYHTPNVSPVMYADFLSADSAGTYFGKHIKPLPFKKYRLVAATA